MTGPTLDLIRAARERIRDQVVFTPCSAAPGFRGEAPGRLHLKLETRQRTGSFKDRGALNRLLHLSDEEKARGVITASAGNHAQAVAFHAGRMGIPATVVMPESTPLIKISNTRRHGARVILHGKRFSEAIEESKRLRDEEGLVMIHAYDDEQIIAGQGTIALELLEQVPGIGLAVVPIGGGGIISGIALGLKSLKPGVRVVGVEVEAAPSARLSRDAGRIVEVETADTLADGIAVKRLGDLTFPLVEKYVDDIVVVGEEEIARAILLLLEREKLVVEGAGAAPLAALLSGQIRARGDEDVVAVLCGGNIDVNIISRIIDRGLVNDGRMTRLVVRVSDRPGSLARLTALVAEAGGNVLEVAHQRAFADISVGGVEIVVHLETRGRDHVADILERIRATGTPVEEVVRPVRAVGRPRATD
jgi:threonine dehydratase